MVSKTDSPHGKRKILVVDDHPLFRSGLVSILNEEKDLRVCGEAPDGMDALRQAASLHPDLVIVDISLDGMNGIDLAKQLRQRFPKVGILILSMHKESIYADRALRAGANGYIMKRESGDKLLEAIRKILQGEIYVSKAVNDMMLQKISLGKAAAASPIERLSDRELEVFRYIGDGYGSRQIADELKLSIKTIEAHREHIREKLNMDTSFELAQFAIRWVHHEAGTA